MKLLVLAVPYDHGHSGISVYMKEVVKALSQAGHQLKVIVEKSAANDFAQYDTMKTPDLPAAFSMLYCLFILPLKIHFKQYDSVLILAANRRTFCCYPIFTVSVVHDLSQYHVPQKYDLFRTLYIKLILPFFVRRSPLVCAISDSTRNDLIEHWHVAQERLAVVYNGVSFRPGHTTAYPARTQRPYILYISRVEHPGKNHLNLLKAFEMLPLHVQNQYDLLCVGSFWSNSDQVLKYAKNSFCHEHFIFTGFVPDDELSSLYQHAAMYIFPSLYEGFGLSLLEAMHYKLPCACSNTSSLHDLGLGAAELFDPEDPETIAVAIFKILDYPENRNKLIAAGTRRVAQFAWTKTAAELIKICRYPRARLLGLQFFAGSMTGALELIDREIARSRQLKQAQNIYFVNAHCLNIASHDPDYRQLLTEATALFADGIGIKIGCKIKGYALRGNVNGTDMLPYLLQTHYTIYLLGGAPGVAETARQKCLKQYPHAQIIGVHDGYFVGFEAEVVSEINQLKPDILLVGFGVPLQEKWIAHYLPFLKCQLAIGVGGLFDFASEKIPRAPRFMRRLGLEWLFRLYQEPRRLFKRYILGNPAFLCRVFFSREK